MAATVDVGMRVEATQRIVPEGRGHHSPAADADHHAGGPTSHGDGSFAAVDL